MFHNPTDFDHILNNIEGGIAFIDDDNKIIYANSQYRRLHPIPDDCEDHTLVLEAFPLNERVRVRNLLDAMRSENGERRATLNYVTYSGTNFLDTFDAVFDEMGNRLGITIKTVDLGEVAEIPVYEETKEDEQKNEIIAKLDETVRKQEHVISCLSELIKISERNLPLDILMEQFLDALMEMFSVDAGVVKLVDPQQTFFYPPKIFHGLSDSFLKKIGNGLIGECICAKAVAERDIYFTHDAARDKENRCSTCKEEGLKFVAAMPIISQNEIRGVIQLASKKVRHLTDEEKLILKAADLVICSAYESTEAKEELARRNLYFDKILFAGRDAVVVITPEGLIESLSESFAKMVDIPSDELYKKPLNIVFDQLVRTEIQRIFTEDSISDSPVSMETILTGNGGEISAIASLWPVRNSMGQIKMVIAYFRNTDEDRVFRQEIERRDREANSMFNIISFLGSQDSIQVYCRKSLAELSKLMPVMDERFLIYYYDSVPKLLRLIAHDGFEPEYVEENHTISSESYEYKNCINNKVISSSALPPSDIWETIVPLEYRGKVRGVLIVYGKRELPSGLTESQHLGMFGHIMGTVMEKQALYDSLDGCNYVLNSFNEKINIVSDGLNHLDPAEGRKITMERICQILIDAANCERLVYTLFIDDNTWRYSYNKQGELREELDTTVTPSSREEWVLNSGSILHCENISESEEHFAGDDKYVELGIRSVTVIPVMEAGSLCGTLRLECKTIGGRDDVLYGILPIMNHIIITLLRQDVLLEEVKRDLQAQLVSQGVGKVNFDVAEKLESAKKLTYDLGAYADEIMQQTSLIGVFNIVERAALQWLPEYLPYDPSHSAKYEDVVLSVKDLAVYDGLEDSALQVLCDTAIARGKEIEMMNGLIQAAEKFKN